MALLTRKKIILAKIESAYGVDSVPTGAANAILVSNVTFPTLEGGSVERANATPYLGSYAQIPINTHRAIEFDVEVASAGAAGTAAPYNALLRACAIGETLAATGEVTGVTVTAGGTGYSDSFAVTFTGGLGTGATGQALARAGVIQAIYMTARGSGYTSAPTPVLTAGGGTGGTATAGIGSAKYAPVSTGFESVSLRYHGDGQLHNMPGTRGTVEMRLNTAGIPVWHFRMLGLYVAPTSVSDPTPTFTAFQSPVPTTNYNTPVATIHGTAVAVRSCTITLGNQVEYRELAGGSASAIVVVDRKVTGNIVIEAPALSVKNWYDTALAGTLGTFRIQQGIGTGKVVDFSTVGLNTCQVLKPSTENEDQGIQMLPLDLVFVPTAAGNNEVEWMVA